MTLMMNHRCNTRVDGGVVVCRDCLQEWHVTEERPACLMPRFSDDRMPASYAATVAVMAAALGWVAAIGALVWWLS